MADIYIDSNAASGGDGSIDAPYNDLTVVNTWAADMSGDTAYFAAGSIFYETLSIIGSATNYSINAYGDGDKPVFNGSTAVTWIAENDIWYVADTVQSNAIYNDVPLIWVSNKVDLVDNTAWYDSGNNRTYIKVSVNPNTAGIRHATLSHAGLLYDPTEVRDCVFKHAYDMALGCLLLTDGNSVYSCDFMWGGSPGGTGRDNLVMQGKTTVVEVIATNIRCKYNTFLGADNNNIELWNLDSAVFSDNTHYGCSSNEYELWRNVANSTFERNKVFARGDRSITDRNGTGSSHFTRIFGYGGAATTTGANNGNIFRNNLCVGSPLSDSAIVVEGLNDNNLFYNNTIVGFGTDTADSPGAGILISYTEGGANAPTGTEFKNNIVVSKINKLSTPTFMYGNNATCVTVFDGNIYWNDAAVGSNARFRPDSTIGYVTAIATWNAQSFVTDDVHANPELTSTYEIESGSSAEGIGATGLVETDINGYYRYGTVDAGCYQIRDLVQTTSRVETEA